MRHSFVVITSFMLFGKPGLFGLRLPLASIGIQVVFSYLDTDHPIINPNKSAIIGILSKSE